MNAKDAEKLKNTIPCNRRDRRMNAKDAEKLKNTKPCNRRDR